MRHCASNLCQDLGDASELTTDAQRVANALNVYSVHMQGAYREHLLNKSNECTVHSVLLACSAGHAF